MDATDVLTKRVSELRDRNRDIYTSRVLAFLDKQKELTTENLSDINAYLTPKVMELQSHLWITDTVSYRYGVTVPVEGQYFIRVNDPAITSIQINGVESNVSKTTPLQAGYYQIEIRKNSPAKPTVLLELQSFTKIEKTTDPISLFVYPFTFDSRWKLVTKSQQSIQQVLVNGYANGWILSKNDNVSTFDLRYMPQRVFIIGFWVSITSLIVGGYYLITLIRRNHHKLL
jgi:hypothetical protein